MRISSKMELVLAATKNYLETNYLQLNFGRSNFLIDLETSTYYKRSHNLTIYPGFSKRKETKIPL